MSQAVVNQAPASLKSGGFLRERQIVPGLIPISRATWWRWIREGKAPAGFKLSGGVTAWKADDVAAFIANFK